MQDVHAGPGQSIAVGLNIHDEIVGEVDPTGNPSASEAFQWSPTTGMQVLAGLPGAVTSFASDINDHGVIVGRSDFNGPQVVVWYGPTVVRLTDQVLMDPGWQLIRADAINNFGQIAGYGTDPSGRHLGWLLTPVRMIVPRLFCYRDVGQWHASPSVVIGSIYVDGGGIVIHPNGSIQYVRPPRPDPVPFVDNPMATEALLRLAFQRHGAEPGGAAIEHIVSEIVEREARSVLKKLGRDDTL